MFHLIVSATAVYTHVYIVRDLIKALSGNSSVNTVQQAKIQKAVFRVRGGHPAVGGGHVTCVFSDACPFLGYISDRIHSVQGRVNSR
jgi:hypothetical protein